MGVTKAIQFQPFNEHLLRLARMRIELEIASPIGNARMETAEQRMCKQIRHECLCTCSMGRMPPLSAPSLPLSQPSETAFCDTKCRDLTSPPTRMCYDDRNARTTLQDR